jgi:hypothetical protein
MKSFQMKIKRDSLIIRPQVVVGTMKLEDLRDLIRIHLTSLMKTFSRISLEIIIKLIHKDLQKREKVKTL